MGPRIVLLFSLFGSPTDGWIGADKVRHFVLSAFAESVAYAALRSTGVEHRTALGAAFGATVVLGVGREVHDLRRKGLFSVRDLAWDIAGAAAAWPILEHTER
jgi:putative lipoprotein